MSLRDEKIKSLLGTNLDELSEEELKKLCKKILKSKIHGICFSLYEGSQQPGDLVSDELKFMVFVLVYMRVHSNLVI